MTTASGTSPQQHVQLVAILTIVVGAFALFGGLIVLLVGSLVFAVPAPEVARLQVLFGGLLLLVLAFGGLHIAAGWGLLKRRPWARTLTMVVAAISLINFPLGTAYGVYALWALSRPDITAHLQAAQ